VSDVVAGAEKTSALRPRFSMTLGHGALHNFLDCCTATWQIGVVPSAWGCSHSFAMPRQIARRLPMAAAETMKKTVEQFSTASNQAFKDGVEKSLAALAEANTVSKKNLEAVVASVTAATKGAEALGAETFAYSKKAAEDQVAAVKSLAGAKSVQEAMELQTTWAKSALEAYIAQMSKASEIVSASIKDSMKPLNERASAAVEKFQAAR